MKQATRNETTAKIKHMCGAAVLEKSYENVANLQLMEIINAININNKSTLLMATTAFVRRFFFLLVF